MKKRKAQQYKTIRYSNEELEQFKVDARAESQAMVDALNREALASSPDLPPSARKK